MRKLSFLLALIALFAVACAPAEKPVEEAPAPAAEPEPVEEEMAPTALAKLLNAAGEEVGYAKFVQAKSAVILTAQVRGVERPGPHGFHVHEVGECVAPDFKSAGGHYNPMGTEHACPDTPVRHAGDFGNIEIGEDGMGRLEIPSDLVTVTPGEISVIDRAVVLHEGTDNCTGQPTGDAGGRLACGVIRFVVDEQSLEGLDEIGETDGTEAGES